MRLASGGLKLKSWLSHRPVIVFGVIALLGLTIIISISPSFQDCFREHKHDPEYKALQEGIGYLRRMARLRLNRACAGDFVDKNDKAINALIAFFTFLLWVSTHRLWTTARDQSRDMKASVRVARQAATAALAQAQIAKRTLVLAQRPWIIVDVKIAGPMAYGPNGADFIFEYIMENVGNSPAFAVFPDSHLYSKTKAMPPENTVLKNRLSPDKHKATDPFGLTIGPKAKHSLKISQAISYEEIRNTVESYRFNGRVSRMFPVYLVGVVAYRSPVSSDLHETSYYYSVFKFSEGSSPNVVGLSVEDTDIEASRLVLEKSLLYSPYMT